jgi:membrane protease YdiL (CAAX protease family)
MEMSTDPESPGPDFDGLAPLEPLPHLPAPVPAPKDIWKPRDLLLFLGFMPVALVVSRLMVLMGYAMLRPFAGWRETTDAAQSETVFMLIEQCLFYLLIVFFLFLLAKLGHGQPFWKSVGWKKPSLKLVVGCLLGGAALAIIVNLAMLAQPDSQDFPLEKLFNSVIACYAIGAFAIAVAPFVEELVFRGLLFAVVERGAGTVVAVIVSAVLFAGLHVPEYWPARRHIAMILVVGLVFSSVRGATGSLTPGILMHLGYNSLLLTGLFFSTPHFRDTQGVVFR